jgi:uncharacterized membrane protein (UPF0127 family)
MSARTGNANQLGFRHALMMGFVAVMLFAAGALSLQRHARGGATVLIDGRVRVDVMVADTEPERMQGLSGHPGLAPDEGMLFVFETPGEYGFWMKDMLFPLDFLWIRDGVIADITVDVPPPVPGERLPSYFPKVPVDQVLELPAGFVLEHRLGVGMPVTVSVEAGE